MPADLSDNRLRSAFRDWALKKITSTPDHPLQCLVDDRTGTWHQNLTRFPDQPSVDAGHTTSKWTGASPRFALEDTDFNRTLNHGENKTREGVFFEKPAVSIRGVPVERRTALMLEKTGKLKAGTVAAAPSVKGAAYSTEQRGFRVEEISEAPPRAVSTVVPTMKSNVALRNIIGKVASDQNAVAFVGESIGVVSTCLNEKGIALKVQDQLRTKYAGEISAIHAAGDGVLVIVRIQRYANPSPDYHLENADLIGVDVVRGGNCEEAMSKWRKPKYLVGPSEGYRIDESYMWLTRPKVTGSCLAQYR